MRKWEIVFGVLILLVGAGLSALASRIRRACFL